MLPSDKLTIGQFVISQPVLMETVATSTDAFQDNKGTQTDRLNKTTETVKLVRTRSDNNVKKVKKVENH